MLAVTIIPIQQQTRCSRAVTGWGHIRDNWAARTRGTRGTRGAGTRHVPVSVLQQGCTITIDGYPEICFVLGLGTLHSARGRGSAGDDQA